MDRPVHGGNLPWAAQMASCSPDELLDFSASISPLGPPVSVKQAIQAAFSYVAAYPDPAYADLREAIASHHAIPSHCVLAGNGAAELLTWAARDLADLPGPTFQLVPGFSDYARALSAFGGECSPVSLQLDEGWRFKGWKDNLSGDIPLNRCGFLLNNPHNPTGALFSREQVRSLISKFALVIVDEAFMDFLPPECEQSVIEWVSEFDNLVVIRSLTKFYSMPGIRLGYAIAQPKTLARWQSWRDAWTVNTFAAAAGIAALQDIEFQQKTWQWLTAENAFLFQKLSALPGLEPLPSCANFFLVETQCSATALQAQLLRQHQIYIRDCISFSELGDRYFRVAVKSRADNQRLLQALADVLPTLVEVSCAG
ncbi:MAG: threonine-phosphate decarboxylase CobD [Cyanobacteria bacterium J06631_9]